MRKFILIAAMLLASASAQAGQLRSLSLASSNDPVIVDQSRDQAKTVTAPQPTIVTQADQATQAGSAPETTAAPTEPPKYVERPPAVSTTTSAPTSDAPSADTPRTEAVKSDAAGPRVVRPAVNERAKADKARRRNVMTAARLIHELHHYGIYW
jgi:hypothetical protein